jgi:hypothetical protein
MGKIPTKGRRTLITRFRRRSEPPLPLAAAISILTGHRGHAGGTFVLAGLRRYVHARPQRPPDLEHQWKLRPRCMEGLLEALARATSRAWPNDKPMFQEGQAR